MTAPPVSDVLSWQTIRDPLLTAARVEWHICRLDQLPGPVAGNKLYKLRHNLTAARRAGYDTLLTFGGAYSNHLRAVAAAGRLHSFRTIGLVRGEPHAPLNPSLQFAAAQGMALHYLDRATYRQRHTPEWLAALPHQFGRCYLLPEGGSNGLAVRGVADLINADWPASDWVVCPVGTGGTLAGLAAGLAQRPTQVLGIAVLKGAGFLQEEVLRLLAEAGVARTTPWSLALDHHAGGYAKATPALRTFIAQFTARHGVPLEPVYSGKMFWALWTLVAQGFFAPGSRLIAVHTGGVDWLPVEASPTF